MRDRAHKPTQLTSVALFCLLLLPSSLGQSDGDWIPGDDYLPGDYGRVKYRDNGVSILRTAYDPGQPPVSDAETNAPVFPGDAILTDYDQRAEVELAGGSLIRVDRDTEVTFQALPDPYADVADNTVLQLAEGTIQVTAYLGEMEEFRVDTPSASVYLLGDGDFRIEVNSQGRTRVTSSRGVAELVGDGGSVLVRAGTLSEVFVGSYPLAPEPFNTFAVDSFDSWVDEREAIYTIGDRYSGYGAPSAEVYEELPAEVQPYYTELNGHGSWVDTVEYGVVWVPSGVAADWRPYNDGYWEYGPQGYFWVSSEPWGWAPYHYGRWSWVPGYGWGWIPGRVFGGAWVAWSWGDAYVGWAPLSYWNTPVYLGPAYYDYYDRYSWTFISYTHISYRDCRRYAVPVDRIGPGLGHTAVVTRPPRIPPNQLSDSQLMRDRAVAYAATDRESRVRSPYRDRRPPTTMRDVERNLSRKALDSRGASGGRTAGVRGAAPSVNRQPSGSRGTPARSRSDSASRRRQEGLARDGTQATRSGATSRTSPVERRGNDRTADPSRGQPSRGQPSRAGSSESADRVRDLYRKAASPRTTRQRSDSSTSPVPDRRSSSRGDSSRQGARPPGRTATPPARTNTRSPSGSSSQRQGAAPPRPSSRRSPPAASPGSSGTSGARGRREAQRPSSGSSGSRTGAQPRGSSSSGSSRSGASPSRSSSGGSSRSGASPSRSSSGGSSRSGASPSRSSSGGSSKSSSGSSAGSKRGGKR